MPRQLCIVSRANPSLYGYLVLALPPSDDREILLDRRQEEREQEAQAAAPSAYSERATAARDAERRRVHGIDDSLRERGWVMLTQDARSGGWVDEPLERMAVEAGGERVPWLRPTLLAAAGFALIIAALAVPVGFGYPLPRPLALAVSALNPWPEAPPSSASDLARAGLRAGDTERGIGQSTAAPVREETRPDAKATAPVAAAPAMPQSGAQRPALPEATATNVKPALAAPGSRSVASEPKAAIEKTKEAVRRSEAAEAKAAAEAAKAKEAARARMASAEAKATADAARDAAKARAIAAEAKAKSDSARDTTAKGERAVEAKAKTEGAKDTQGKGESATARAEPVEPKSLARSVIPFEELPRVELVAEEAGSGSARTVAYTVKLRDRAGQPVTASEVTVHGADGVVPAARLTPTATPGTFQGRLSAPFPRREDLRVRVVADGKRFELPVDR